MFGVNIALSYYNNYSEKVKQDESYNCGFSETYKLLIDDCLYDEENPGKDNIYLTYELQVPVNLLGEDMLTLRFFPNGLFELGFLPFSNLWRSFLADLSANVDRTYGRYGGYEGYLAFIYNIRNCYINLLKKIDCSRIILWTDGNYKTEEDVFYNQYPGRKDSIDGMIKQMARLDNMKIYNFMDALHQKVNFPDLKKGCLDSAFIDEIL